MASLLTAIEFALSKERLAPYRQAMDNNLHAALQLYEWNTAISSAFWADIANLEVLVRNTMHEQLTRWSLRNFSEPRWYLDPGHLLTPQHLTEVSVGRRRAKSGRHPTQETPGRVIAELSFGFWRYLLSGHYELTLWRQCLHYGFPGQPHRKPIHERIAWINELRNRIAHHEPIYRKDLSNLREELFRVINWIDPKLCSWVERQSTVADLLAMSKFVRRVQAAGR